MFIKIKNIHNEELIVNYSQISIVSNNIIIMSNGMNIELSKEEIIKFKNDLLDQNINSITEVNDTNKNSDLLNELNKLMGGSGVVKLTSDRKARLKARLKDFSVEDLKLASKNLGSDEFMQGANDNNKKYATVDYLLRSSANVNIWLEAVTQKKKSLF